ncbi:MAG: class I SAM-dependent methyltransferase [Candidatus Yanofskybacteria bacterium]|nr:class I SAM-dependent methyltransferase [Candidatus Yanofskybacteria bacterium]
MQFDEFYEKPDGKLRERRLREYRKLFIVPFFPKDKNIRILDLGCGYGLLMLACLKSGYGDVSGVDFNIGAVEYARTTLGLNNVAQGDAFNYLESQPVASFDVIVAANFVEHIKKELIPRLFKLIAGRIKSGGLFIAEVPNADSIHGIHTFFSDMTHEWAYTKPLIMELLNQAGLSDVRVFPNRVRANKLIRVAQKILTKIVSGDDKLQYSGSIVVVARKK